MLCPHCSFFFFLPFSSVPPPSIVIPLMSRLLPHYSKGKTAFLCVDLQKAFAPRIANFANCVFVANQFAALHEVLKEETKYVVTEQYPKGLGNTVPEIKVPNGSLVVPKTQFSCIVPEVVTALKDVDNVVLFGIEGHACILQTAAELLDMKKKVALPVDGIGSQKATDLGAAIELMRTWGPDCFVTSTESIILQMTKGASDPKFKQVSGILKNKHPIEI
ncbi:MAR1 ribonuclease [Angomonas deanei]|nr:MAR1 ribonuclease [Angomonas deanei]|eukprot:EPY39284.1 MAR1 ribonuclease [Angomonas deanei]